MPYKVKPPKKAPTRTYNMRDPKLAPQAGECFCRQWGGKLLIRMVTRISIHHPSRRPSKRVHFIEQSFDRSTYQSVSLQDLVKQVDLNKTPEFCWLGQFQRWATTATRF